MEIICLYGNPDSGKTEVLNMLAKKILKQNKGCKIFYARHLYETNYSDSSPGEIERFIDSNPNSDWNLILEWNTKKIGFTMKGDNSAEIKKGLLFIDSMQGVDIFLIPARRKGSLVYKAVEQHTKGKQDIDFTPIKQRKIRDNMKKEDITIKNRKQVDELFERIKS